MTGPCMQAVMHVFKHDANGYTNRQGGGDQKTRQTGRGREGRRARATGEQGFNQSKLRSPFFGVRRQRAVEPRASFVVVESQTFNVQIIYFKPPTS